MTQFIIIAYLSVYSTIPAALLVPILVAPASIIACAFSKSRTPPEAFTPISGPTVSLIRRISSTFAPPVENPVDVLTKSAPASFAAWHAFIFLHLSEDMSR